MKKRYTIVVFAIALILTGCGNDTKELDKERQIIIPVKTSTVVARDSAPFFIASGKIASVNSADLSTRIMGFVKKVHVKVGEKVTKGQLLVSISNADLSAKNAQVTAGITEATAAFTNAERDFNRFKNLFQSNSASQKEMDDITTQYEMAKARLEAARQMKNEVTSQYSYVNIRAPFNGIITNNYTDEGAMANPGVPLVSMEAPGLFEVDASVPESEISQIKKGAKVKVVVNSLDQTVSGSVTEISTSAKNTGGQYIVKIVLDTSDVGILSGMYAAVQFPVERENQTASIFIPSDIIVTKGQLSGIYTVTEDNKALLRWLRLGRSFGDQVEVLSGLSEDEPYIISAEGKLYNGARLSIQ